MKRAESIRVEGQEEWKAEGFQTVRGRGFGGEAEGLKALGLSEEGEGRELEGG
jgi:hypothetical protein